MSHVLCPLFHHSIYIPYLYATCKVSSIVIRRMTLKQAACSRIQLLLLFSYLQFRITLPYSTESTISCCIYHTWAKSSDRFLSSTYCSASLFLSSTNIKIICFCLPRSSSKVSCTLRSSFSNFFFAAFSDSSSCRIILKEVYLTNIYIYM